MNCEKSNNKRILEYLENMLTPQENLAFEAHIGQCVDCQRALQTEKAIGETLENSVLKPLPTGYSEALSARLAAAQEQNKKKGFGALLWRNKRWLAAVAVCLIVAFGVARSFNSLDIRTADAAPQESLNQFDGGYQTKTAEDFVESKGINDTGDANLASETVVGDALENSIDADAALADDLQARKLVKRGNITLSVTDYDVTLDQIETMLGRYGGYIENSNVTLFQKNLTNRIVEYRQGSVTLRIPNEQFQAAFRELLALGEVSFQEQSSEDLTNIYRDTVNEVKNLEVREAALRDIMDRAETVEDIITVEYELSRVRGEINRLSGNLQQWDRLVDMSTIQLSIEEKADDAVVQPIDDGLIGRAQRAFVASLNQIIDYLEDVFIGFVGLLPLIIPLVVILTIVLVIVLWRRKK